MPSLAVLTILGDVLTCAWVLACMRLCIGNQFLPAHGAQPSPTEMFQAMGEANQEARAEAIGAA